MARISRLILAGLVLSACNPQEPDPGTDTNQDSDPIVDTEPGVQPVVCDVPADFRQSCGGSGCHGPSNGAAGLDLESPGLIDRVSMQPATQCLGLLADPIDPTASVLYTKLQEDNSCGARMPIGRPAWTDDQMACLSDWIAALPPPAPDDTSVFCADCECTPETTETCYTGVTPTEGVGQCVEGERTCSFQGTWGPCDGQVLPSIEDCTTAGDEDCDGTDNACSPVWRLNVGTHESQSMRSVATDSQGNVWVLGDFEDGVDFGTGTLVADGVNSDIVLTKFSPNGVPMFARHWGDSSNQYATKVHVDAADNVLIMGRAFGKIDFGGGLLDAVGTDDVFLAKFDSSGTHVWSRIFGGIDPDRAERIATDSAGDVYVTGTFTGSADFGFGPVTSAGAREAFVMKLGGGAGNHVWSQILSSPGDAYGFGIDVDSAGNVYVAARYQQTLSNQTQAVVSAGGYDMAIAKYDSLGVLQWLDSFGGPSDDRVNDLVVADTGGTEHVVVVGHFQDSVPFDNPPLTSLGSYDLFVVSLDLNGNTRWARRFGDADDQFETSHDTNTWLTAVASTDGSVWVGGSYVGTIPLAPLTLTSAGRNDLFLLQLNGADGSYLGANTYGGGFTEYLLDFDLFGTDYVVVAGRFSSRSGFSLGAAGQVRGAGSFDGFAARLPQ